MALPVFPTHIPDIDREILFQQSDERLATICQADRYINELCNGPAGVWRRKFAERYIDLGPRNDYAQLYADMAQAESPMDVALRSGSTDLLIWALNRSGASTIIDPAIYLFYHRDIYRFERWLEWMDQNRPEKIDLPLLLTKTVKYGALDALLLLVDRYDINLRGPTYEELLLSSENMTGRSIVDYLWQYATPKTKRRFLDHAVKLRVVDLVHYAVDHGVDVNYDTITKLLHDSAGLKGLNTNITIDLLNDLLMMSTLPDDEIYSLMFDYVRWNVDSQIWNPDDFDEFRYYLERLSQAPLIALAGRLSDGLLSDKKKDLAVWIVNYDLDELLNYLWVSRMVDVEPSVYQMMERDAVGVFALWLDRLATKMPSMRFYRVIARMMMLAIKADAIRIVRLMLGRYFAARGFQDEFVKTALANGSLDTAIYLLTESQYVDDDNYEEQYDLVKRIVDEEDIDKEMVEEVLEAMERYEETGMAYPEEEND